MPFFNSEVQAIEVMSILQDESQYPHQKFTPDVENTRPNSGIIASSKEQVSAENVPTTNDPIKYTGIAKHEEEVDSSASNQHTTGTRSSQFLAPFYYQGQANKTEAIMTNYFQYPNDQRPDMALGTIAGIRCHLRINPQHFGTLIN